MTFIPRISVHWGHSSQVECEMNLIEAAVYSNEEYCYMHLLSGADLQIKKTEDIHRFFDDNPNKQFLSIRNVYSGMGGLARYYFFLPLRTYNKYIAKVLDVISERIQKALKVNRLEKIDYNLCKSQQWFSITGECAKYVLSRKGFIHEFSKYTCCADEMFLGTVIVNSEFKSQIHSPYRNPNGHMRLIDRERCEAASPRTWTMKDWDMIVVSPCFWARKFDLNRDKEIIEKVFEYWR